MRLKNKVAIITGGGKGLGKAYAENFSNEGAKVVIADIDFNAATSVAKEIQGKGADALPISVDVSDEKSVTSMVAKTLETFGRIDILVNNAAIMLRFIDKPMKAFDEYTVEEWDRVMAVNVRGVWLCCKAVFPQMKKQGKGKIINAASNVFFQGRPVPWLLYITTKGAVVGLTRSLAKEIGPYGIRVNAFAPGLTLTETVAEQLPPEAVNGTVSGQAIKQKAYANDIVGTVLFLASDDSDFVSGQTIVVDGGHVVH